MARNREIAFLTRGISQYDVIQWGLGMEEKIHSLPPFSDLLDN